MSASATGSPLSSLLRDSARIMSFVPMPEYLALMRSGAVLTSDLAALEVSVVILTAMSLARTRGLTASTHPSRDLGTDVPSPAAACRAASSASTASFLSAPLRLLSRLGLSTSRTLKPRLCSLSVSPAPNDAVPSTPTTGRVPGSPMARARAS